MKKVQSSASWLALLLHSRPEKFSKFRKDERGISMDDDNSTGTNMIWAVAMIIIVAMIAGALYYSGALSGRRTDPTQKIDVEVSTPSR